MKRLLTFEIQRQILEFFSTTNFKTSGNSPRNLKQSFWRINAAKLLKKDAQFVVSRHRKLDIVFIPLGRASSLIFLSIICFISVVLSQKFIGVILDAAEDKTLSCLSSNFKLRENWSVKVFNNRYTAPTIGRNG